MPDVDSRVRPILDEGLDEALRSYITRQMTNWLNDPHTDSAERALLGAQKAVAAYQNARGLRNGLRAPIEHLKILLREGLDRAMRDHIVKLFGEYLRQGGVVISKALLKDRDTTISTYLKVRDAIDKLK